MTLCVVVGLAGEARLLGNLRGRIVICGGGAADAFRAVEQAVVDGATALLSFADYPAGARERSNWRAPVAAAAATVTH